MQICICRDRVEYVKLKEICMPKQWKTIASSMLKDSGYPVYGANGIIGYYSDYNHDKETILVTCRGATCGTVNICKPFSYINGNAMALDNLDGKIDIKYLYYYLKKRGFDDVISGSAQPQITRTSIEKIEIPTCEISKQKMLVNLFDKIELLINDQKRQLQLLDELVRARFVEMFGDPEDNPFKWDKMPLSNIMLNANNGMARRGNDENGNIVLRLVELQDGYIDYSNPNRICLNENEKKRYLLKNNDFLFARVNGNPDNVGRCAVFHDIGEDVYHNDHIIRVHFNEELLNGVFASELINSNFGKRQLKKRIKTSAGQYTVSQDGIGAIVSIVPPLELQNQFASFVQEIDKSRLLSKHSLSLIKFITF